MRKTRTIRILAVSLTVSITMLLGGCGANSKPTSSGDSISKSNKEYVASSENTSNPSEEQTTPYSETIELSEDALPQETIVTTEQPTEPEKDENGLTEQQRNSFSMLYYLAITAENIRISKDNRLILEDIYSSLFNDINPEKIDEITQDHLENLRDIIKSYMNVSVKRDRIQYIYNQDKAAAIRSAVPDPLAILTIVNSVDLKKNLDNGKISLDWKKLAASVVYTIVDSYNNYKSMTEAIDKEFLMSGWELDDKETAAIQKNRERAFDYMVDIVQEYDLDGKMTLNEKAIETFAQICEIESVQQKIHRLESEEETYKLLGNYWLELADCYYQTSQYEKCLDCVDKYNDLATGIYREDYNYVQILPKAIVAAQEIYIGDEYISNIQTFADAIIGNTDTEEWAVRYFAAQVYLDLYARTDDREYLEVAYNIAYDNVTILLDEQRKLNTTYLEDVKKVIIPEPDYRFMSDKEKKEAEKEYKAEQKRLNAYNKSLEDTRETELPPLYEPFVLNCDLLFALAGEMNISDKEKSEIEDILQTDENGVFLSKPVNDYYSFTTAVADYKIEFTKDEILVPTDLLSTGAEIIVSASDSGEITTFDDCVVSEVLREGDTINTFKTIISGKMMKDYDWTENSKVTVKIINNKNDKPLTYKFKVIEFKDNWLIDDKVVFAEE